MCTLVQSLHLSVLNVFHTLPSYLFENKPGKRQNLPIITDTYGV